MRVISIASARGIARRMVVSRRASLDFHIPPNLVVEPRCLRDPLEIVESSPHLGASTRQSLENRTITVNLPPEATDLQRLGDGQAFVELVTAVILSSGFQLAQGDLSRRRLPDASLA